MRILSIAASRPYTVFFEKHERCAKKLIEFCAQDQKKLMIISDTLVGSLYAEGLQVKLCSAGLSCETILVPASEVYKTRETKAYIEDQLLLHQCDRHTRLIALGGGMVTDLAGFTAATFYRGIPVIYVPTTVLAMADATIGGKTAINMPQGKNLIGSFTSPEAVFIDLGYLKSLSVHEWKNGLAEIIKHALIADQDLLQQLQRHQLSDFSNNLSLFEALIFQSLNVKKQIVEADENETGMRAILNFGHTIGHAIEQLENYSMGHGIAVAIGMLVEANLAMRLGCLSESNYRVIEALLRQYQFPLYTNVFSDIAALKQVLRFDKKNRGQHVHCVLLTALGHCLQIENRYSHPVADDVLHSVLQWATSYFSDRCESSSC